MHKNITYITLLTWQRMWHVILCLLCHASLWWLKNNKRPTWCHLLFYFTCYVLNMFRTLIYPSSGACDYSVELPHWSYCSWFDMCWSFDVVGLEWYPCCRLQPATRISYLARNKAPWWWSDEIETCRSVLKCFKRVLCEIICAFVGW